MPKLQRQIKTKDGHQKEIVHQEYFDDNYLPPSDELERLQKVKPEIIDWIMKRA